MPSYRFEDFQEPAGDCDLVVQGSGYVDPLPVCDLARQRRLHNVGGSSAGGLTAAAAAAAECGRHSPAPTAGFQGLGTVPDLLAAPARDRLGRPHPRRSKLRSLFQPGLRTRPLLVFATSLSRSPVRALLRAWPLPAAAGAGLAAGAWALACGASGLSPDQAAALAGLAMAAPGGALAGAGLALRRALRALPSQGFGICTGGEDPDRERPFEPLTWWLADLLDCLAGRDPVGDPLTFGDLWLARSGDLPEDEREARLLEAEEDPARRDVNLVLLTTGVSLGRPCSLPFPRDALLFREEDLARLFPPRVVRWMVRKGLERSLPRDGWLPLPLPADLPVVVAARLSVGLPPLLSAVRLGTREGREAWFSDGGLVSDFPPPLFDSTLPPWPTVTVGQVAPRPFEGMGGFLLALIEASRQQSALLAPVAPWLPERYRSRELTPRSGN